jgi:hypothetical protein
MLYTDFITFANSATINFEIFKADTSENDTDKKTESKTKEHLCLLQSQVQEVLKKVEKLIDNDIEIRSPEELEELEKEIVDKTDKLAGLILGVGIQKSLNSQELKDESAALIKSFPKKMKNQGAREIVIRPLRGDSVTVKTEYFSPKAKKDKRKKNRKGCYPGLVLLGIYDRCTPGMASEIALMATALSSFKEAQEIFYSKGIELNIKTIQRITVRFSERARKSQLTQTDEFTETVAGCRVVISTDGGRIRIREKKRGQKTKKGRNRYKASWHEPKVLIIYTVDEDGRMNRSFAPIIDGTLKGPDAVFSLIKYYLDKVGICKADKILFIADGARWIWNRVEKLMTDLGIGQWYELLDFYHVVEHLNKIADLQKGWKKPQKKRWVTKYRRLMLKGQINKVLKAVRQVCGKKTTKKRTKKLRTEKDYFVRNKNRLRYDKIGQAGMPIGSGSIESAVRRVINLRLKSASTYWLRETAEAMLMLRSYFKAGRWNMLKKLSFNISTDSII